ncbi:hypothetical protein [Sinomicrobium weinanense]|uniref:Uncharacterized protein n=1 Tax=Sinomicrobium weinanense TaxID=2842200 RepID=A0A926Q3M9_9FLAO|nr:hypothetical protein [Sinomicrobium weinanense]MBC9797723.1 hypothetical protein [Sinomicrobium weinanense]MBU3123614.1 hypothetical protein [Sinomicrobium weinanense]
MADKYSFYTGDREYPEPATKKKTPEVKPIADSISAKYRCEQVNTTKIDGKLTSNSQQKFQFNVQLFPGKNTARVTLEDHYYNMDPPVLNKVFDFVTQTEFIRHDVAFTYGADGSISEILNKEEQAEKWRAFKNSKAFRTEFITSMQDTNEKGLEEIIKSGDRQFSLSHNSEEELRRELFYTILFDWQLTSDDNTTVQQKEFLFRSILLPGTIVPMNFRCDILKAETDLLKLRKVGSAKADDELMANIVKKYDQYYKPQIKYNFTEYKLEFRQTYEVNPATRLVNEAKLIWNEAIKDNAESLCEFKMRKL